MRSSANDMHQGVVSPYDADIRLVIALFGAKPDELQKTKEIVGEYVMALSPPFRPALTAHLQRLW